MYTVNNVFWAKKNEQKGCLRWLPLGQHLEDTREIIGMLWEHWLNPGQKEFLVGSMSFGNATTAKQVVQFLGAIHDLGKATPCFQTLPGYNYSDDLNYPLLEKLQGFGFKDISDFNSIFRKKSPHALAGQYLLTKFGVNSGIASIVGGHHGRPVNDLSEIKIQRSYENNYFQTENSEDPIYQLWNSEQYKLFERALNLSYFESAEDIPEFTQAGQLILSGLLIMADWISSNENYFPLFDIGLDQSVDQALRLRSGWEKWFKTFPIEKVGYESISQMYQDRFGFSPRSFQMQVAEETDDIDNPGIVILEAPMGEGKTEAALILAEQLMNKTGRSGIFFGLPTQATSNGIFPRVLGWLKKYAGSSLEVASIQLVHGKANLNTTFDLLKHGKSALNVIEESSAQSIGVDNQTDDESVIVNQWFTGRKTSILDDFVVGTVDQFLMVGLKQKHLALRHLGFSRKVVIIDEVHAYDAYMDQYLLEALVWMGAYGVPVIILSATLPVQKRQEFIHAYMKGRGIKGKNLRLTDEMMSSSAYPLMTYSDGDRVRQFNNFQKGNRSLLVTIQKISSIELMGQLKILMSKGGIIGLIVNTVQRAQELFEECVELFGEERIFLLHSKYLATHRIQKEKQLMSEIGKGADRPSNKLIIGTQVIEQSLDIDFDCLISDLAPMDLLIQRVGRLHRHMIERPIGFQTPVFYVLDTSPSFDFEPGSVHIYGNYILAKTQLYLPDTLLLPEDISPLVQKVYQTENIEALSTMKEDHDNKIANKESKAKKFRISDPLYPSPLRKKVSLNGLLKNSHPDESEEYSYAQVRDTQETIEVILVKKKGMGYTFIDSDEDISGKIEDYGVSKRLSLETITLPLALTQPYNVSETIKDLEVLNLRYLRDWQNNTWLKGSLGIILNEDLETVLNGYRLMYTLSKGLTYERVKESESF
ncbi:CRISPR-associated helicase/endonuclease Cas3 [Falseniella ignava]|uniref:CRISPR-associated helicase/endonuclease Cas3 n=1 Tax=Falseniella ignava TaxID=137730 RepID=A0A2I1JYY7_9LACT|nr:CRISPR-associated helicase/endonuclease Cas3 [Falseniella ignava]PKY88589.1 CRISPR-associated helicase/endonuclease Cas3 [Falseniella ignava]